MAQGVGHAGLVGAGRRRRCPRVAAQRSRAGQDVLSGHRVLLRQATRHPVAGCLWRGGPRPAEKSQRGEWVASVNVVLPRTLSHRHGISTKDLTHEPAIRERCALPCPARFGPVLTVCRAGQLGSWPDRMQRAALRSPGTPGRAVLARAAGPAPGPDRRRRLDGTVAGPDREGLSTELVGKSVAKPRSGRAASRPLQRLAAALTASRRGPLPSLRPVFHGRRPWNLADLRPAANRHGPARREGHGQRPRRRQVRGRSRPTAAPAEPQYSQAARGLAVKAAAKQRFVV